ncbi:hypothetical protein [Hymenobacter bucti]|uniref:AraC family transcriptional regulator n=1 Tax=Hymenobacter bucti TaxID=1844114 RepID=A0ABW4R286_9BACT
MTEVKLLVQTAGLVLFDPVVLQAFIDYHHLPVSNLWDSFRSNPDLAKEALATGCLLPVHPIVAWDYRVRVAVAAQPTVPAEWVLFAAAGFALHVSSGRVLVADGWALLRWEAAAYLEFGRQPLAANYAANDFRVVQEVRVPNGWYQVTVVGFCER